MSSRSAVLLSWALLGATPAAAGSGALPSCETGVRYLELVADATGEPPEVCIRPGLTTTFLFDSQRVRVELEKHERFRRVTWAEDTLTLQPSGELRDGERLPLRVYFGDGAAPESATLLLVVHPSQAERQVEVSRHPRPAASYRQETQQAREEARQCQEQKMRLQAECGGQAGLSGMIAHSLLGRHGVSAEDISKGVTWGSGAPLLASEVISYRANARYELRGEQAVRLAVELKLMNAGTETWKTLGAALVGPTGETPRVLGVWQSKPMAPGQAHLVVVEVEARKREAQGPFTLKLWMGEGDAQSVTFHGVRFP